MDKTYQKIRMPGADAGGRRAPYARSRSAFPSLDISLQDEAWVGTVRCRIPGDYETATGELARTMETAAGRIEAMGGLVGHIKAFVREERRTCMLSVTEPGDLQKKEGEAKAIHVECAHIVFGLEGESFKSLLTELYQKWLD